MSSTSIAPAWSQDRQAPSVVQLGWWEWFSFFVIQAVVKGLVTCVSLSGLYRIGRMFGTLEWLLQYKRRRRFGAAMERVLGRRPCRHERRKATREFFARKRCDKLLYLIFDSLPRETAVKLLSIGNQAILDAAVSRGKGVYVAMAHHGAHHVIATLMAFKGFKVAGVRDRHESGLRRYMRSRLARRDPDFPRMRVIFADGFPREIYRCLEDGYLLGSAMDVARVRNLHHKTQPVKIFGEERAFLTGPLRIAIRCGSPVLQAFVIPEKDFRYRLEFVEWLADPEQIEDESHAVAEAMKTYAANVERFVRASPSLLSRV